MIDYIIDTKTDKIISGNKNKETFVEYWQFKKNKKNNWVLNKILQEEDGNKIHP